LAWVVCAALLYRLGERRRPARSEERARSAAFIAGLAALHISALTDQQLAAGVMWVPGSLAYAIAIAVIAYRMLGPRDARETGRPAKPLPTGVV
jgi:cytochrome c oxidase assembly factor CtaG